MKSRSRMYPLVALYLLAFAAPARAIAICYVDGVARPGTIQSNDPADGLSGGVCGHTIYGTGGCTLDFTQDQSALNNADCLQVGKGVTIDMGGYKIDCPAGQEPCGYAIRTTTSSGTGKSTVKNGLVKGCYFSSIQLVASGSDEVIDVAVDGQGSSCKSGDIGPYYQEGALIASNVNRVSVRNAARGVSATRGGVVKDSIIRDCESALIWDSYSGTGQATIDHVAVVNNDNALDFYNYSTSGTRLIVKGSFLYGNGTDCYDGLNSTDLGDVTNCAIMSGTTPTIVGDVIY